MGCMRVKQTEIAGIFGVSARSVREWDKAGCPSHLVGKTKEYETAEVIKWYTDRAVAELDILVGDDEVKQAKRAQEIAKAQRMEAAAELDLMRVAQARGDVVSRVVVEAIFNDLVAAFGQELDRVPYRWPAELGACKSDSERRDVLRKAMDAVRTTLSRLSVDAREEEELSEDGKVPREESENDELAEDDDASSA